MSKTIATTRSERTEKHENKAHYTDYIVSMIEKRPKCRLKKEISTNLKNYYTD